MLRGAGQEVRFALRGLRRRPGLAAVIVGTLALAIGANTAIFSLMDALLLQRLPVRDAQHLYLLQWSAGQRPFHDSSSYGDCAQTRTSGCSFSMPFYRELEKDRHQLQAVTASAGAGEYTLNGPGLATTAVAQRVAGNYFSVMGLRPAAGRLLEPSDDRPGAAVALVLGYRAWQTMFGGSAAAVGEQIEMNNVPATIVGVAPASFGGLTPGRVFDGWVTLASGSQLDPNWDPRRESNAGAIYLTLFARAGAAGAGAAQAEVSGLFRNQLLAGGKPLAKASDHPRVELLPAQTWLRGARGQFTEPLTVLMWTVGAILLLACANVAGLLLGRARAREQEFAVRRALGAGAGRLLRQMLIESLLLAGMGGALGLGLAWGLARGLLGFMEQGSYYGTFGFHVALDGRVLLFTLGATVGTGLLFGLAPGLRSARAGLFGALRQGGGNAAGQRRRWLHAGNFLVVAQVALCMVVLAGAGLMVRTLANLRAVDTGFDSSHLLLFSLEPEAIGYKGQAALDLYRRVEAGIAALPGVRGVSYSESPLVTGDLSNTSYTFARGGKSQEADVLPVGLNFFATMKIPVRLGREFAPGDFHPEFNRETRQKLPDTAPPVPAVVNERLVDAYLGGGNPIGRTFGWSNNRAGKAGYVIVGVVGNAKYQDLRSAIAPTVYLPSAEGFATFEVRTAGDRPMAMLAAVRGVLRGIDAKLPLFHPSTQTANIDRLLLNDRLLAGLASGLGGLALLLAAIGLYALLAQEVTRRTREIGIRMALGAERGRVLRLIVGLGATLGVVGMGLGVAGAWGATRYLKSLLYGVQPSDPATLAAAGGVLLAVALAACAVPARRAAGVDPMVALRHE